MSDNHEPAQEIMSQEQIEIPEATPVLGNRNFVLFPFMIAPLIVPPDSDMQLIDDVVGGSRLVGIFAEHPREEDNEDEMKDLRPLAERVYQVGTIAIVLKMLRIPDGSVRLLVHGLRRVRILEEIAGADYPQARIEEIPEPPGDEAQTRVLQTNARELLEKVVEQTALPEDLVIAANNMDDPGRLADLISSNVNIPIEEQQQILEQGHIEMRLVRVLEILNREVELLKLGSKIKTDVQNKLESKQRDYLLREQIKAIRRELGEEDEEGGEIEEIEAAIAKAKMPEYAGKTARKELMRLKAMSPQSSEYSVARTYLDWLTALPWSKKSRDNIDLTRAAKVLNEDHYGLEKVKDRILEYLAVVKMRKSIRGPILCLAGPPGVGKTSLGRSVARSMGRKFVRISLGGVRDEAEVRGHRRTYIGAMPGRIVKSLKDCETRNPIFMLDEIDKLGSDYRGDPSSALLEVLDPEQNYTFTDNYLDMPFDLSDVMFITTANSLDTIPGPLRDRMDVIRLSGYTVQEKLAIAHRYLVPRALKNTGIEKRRVTFTDEGLLTLIERYTREAGLRNLEREITSVCRKLARKYAEDFKDAVTIDARHILDALGPETHDRDELDQRTELPGVAIGLAWTPVGGDILFIEATATPGSGKMTLTGQLGDVMRESVQAARTWLHANARRLKIPEAKFTKEDHHVHVPAGAIPKDGPSAGVAMTVTLASLMRGRAVRQRLAMTGEVTIKGAVLPVGGIKEKMLAAHRSGIREIIMPARNEKDLIDIPSEVREEMRFNFVVTIDEALKIAFEAPRKPRAKKSAKKSAKKAAPKKNVKKKAAKKTAKRKRAA